MRLNNVAIQILREHFRFTTRRRNNGESVHGIFDFLWIAAVDVSDSFTIGTPSRRAFPVRIRVGFRRGRNLGFRLRGWAVVADGEAGGLSVEIGEGLAANVIQAAKSRNATSGLVFMRKESSGGRVPRAN
jgi:hypothetical protein